MENMSGASRRHYCRFKRLRVSQAACSRSHLPIERVWTLSQALEVQILCRTVDFLGRLFRSGRLALAEKNTEAVKQATYPTTRTQMRSFLGMCSVYRRFVQNFAGVASSLMRHTSKNGARYLNSPSEDEYRAFELLKEALTNPPVLRIPDPELPFTVDTDASNTQIGAALFQEFEDDGVRHSIGLWSHVLSETERNYSAMERECLNVIWAIQMLQP